MVTSLGDQLPDGTAQDIEFILSEKDHPVYKRDGDDLRTTVRLSLAEALTGFRRTLQSLDNRPIELSLGQGSDATVVSPGDVRRLGGEGMPTKAGGKGDLIVTFTVDFPRRLDPAKKQQLRTLLT